MDSVIFRCMALAVLTAWPALSWALSLGEITSQSRLNEPLQAEIALHAINPGEVLNARVTLASADAHQRAGLQMQQLLHKLKFAIVHKQSGEFVVKVTTGQPVREPVIEFVLEVNWSGGRLLRDYALHLDPPGV